MPSTKGRYGTGSKQHKGKDKHGIDKWLFVVWGVDELGKPKRFCKMFHGSGPKADSELVLFCADVRRGVELQHQQEKREYVVTLREWSEEFLTRRERDGLAKRTLKGYHDHLTNRILPALGDTPLDKLSSRQIKVFLDQLAGEPMQGPRAKNREKGATISNATRLSHLRTLSAVLREAVYQELIPYNPARDVRPPSVAKKRAKYADTPDIDKFVAAICQEHPRNYAMWLCALGLGLRRGELTALRWEHINWRENVLNVEQSVAYIAGEGELVKTAKSDAGMRVIPMPAYVRQALESCLVQQHLDRHAWAERKRRGAKKITEWRDSDYVFTRTTNGGRLHIETISTLYERFLIAHKLPHINLHGLRHTAVSIWRAGGLSDVDAAALAGHEDPSTTNIYSHAFSSRLRRSADIMDNVLSTKLSTKTQLQADIERG